jgi:hypothetical protein
LKGKIMAQKILAVKDYPIMGGIIKKGTMLQEENSRIIGMSTYIDPMGNVYMFDNSEILFSKEFEASFKLV